MTSKIRKCLSSSTNCTSSLTTSRPSVQSNQKHGFNYVSKLIIIINVILLHCIVGNLCASWQENVRPKLFVQLGKSIFPILFIYETKNAIFGVSYLFRRCHFVLNYFSFKSPLPTHTQHLIQITNLIFF